MTIRANNTRTRNNTRVRTLFATQNGYIFRSVAVTDFQQVTNLLTPILLNPILQNEIFFTPTYCGCRAKAVPLHRISKDPPFFDRLK